MLLCCSFSLSAAQPPPSAIPAQENSQPAGEEVPKTVEETVPPLPSSTEMTYSYENAFVKMLVTLGGLVFLVVATFWILRRLGKGKFKMGAAGRSVNIIDRRPLSPKTMLYIVEVEGKQILVSESQLEVRTLSIQELKKHEEQHDD